MNSPEINNINIKSQKRLISPKQLKAAIPMSLAAKQTISDSRQTIKDILDKKDHRLLVVVGPCSIHDVEAALDYARKLRILADKVSDTLYIVMRVYFEKPRTTTGWKGLINDPHLNDSFKIDQGLYTARNLLLDIAELGLATSTEALDPISPQYLQDLISWSAIGARTTESQTHREMASGLSSPVGFKNGTDGGLAVAINALQSVSSPHRFLGINNQGEVSIINTKGNEYGHIVLRGGSNGPNYGISHIIDCEQSLKAAGLTTAIMIDCSHANSKKNPALQPFVVAEVAQQIINGNRSIIGLMIESNIAFGNQKLTREIDKLEYGVSITDACINFEATEQCLVNLVSILKEPLIKRIQSPQTIETDYLSTTTAS